MSSKKIDGALSIWFARGHGWRWRVTTAEFFFVGNQAAEVIDDAVLRAEALAERLGVRIAHRYPPLNYPTSLWSRTVEIGEEARRELLKNGFDSPGAGGPGRPDPQTGACRKTEEPLTPERKREVAEILRKLLPKASFGEGEGNILYAGNCDGATFEAARNLARDIEPRLYLFEFGVARQRCGPDGVRIIGEHFPGAGA